MIRYRFACIMINGVLVGIALILFPLLSGLLLFILIIRRIRK